MQKNFAVIFDMDGVLIDTLKLNEAAFNHVLEPHGINLTTVKQKHGHFIRGSSLRDLLNLIEQHHGIKFDLHDFSRRAGEYALKILERDRVQADPELVRLLTELKNLGIRRAVGSASQRWRVEQLLKFLKLHDLFDMFGGAEDAKLHKPDPEIYLWVASQLGVLPKQCVVIEDSPPGVEAARRAGMKVIGYDAFNDDDVVLDKADLVVNSFKEITPAIIIKTLSAPSF